MLSFRRPLFGFSAMWFFNEDSLTPQPPAWTTRVSPLWFITLDLSGMGGSTSSKDNASITQHHGHTNSASEATFCAGEIKSGTVLWSRSEYNVSSKRLALLFLWISSCTQHLCFEYWVSHLYGNRASSAHKLSSGSRRPLTAFGKPHLLPNSCFAA